MNSTAILHMTGLGLSFAAVFIGSYGLLREAVLLGLWPLDVAEGRSLRGEASHRLGQVALVRGWFGPLRESARRDLIRARMIDVKADDFVGECLLYAGLGAAAGWFVTVIAGGTIWSLVPAAVMGFILFQVPAWNLRSRAQRRIVLLGRRLPYSLEVVVLATEAGAGFEEALGILVREDPRDPLHEEFDQVLRDSHMGVSRREALHAMADRVDTEDITALVMALDIAEDLGTPFGETLKQQAAAIRHSRLQRAERIAQEAGPKMAVPNTLIMVANVLLIMAPFLPKLAFGGLFQ
jgi:tight adherence protein C